MKTLTFDTNLWIDVGDSRPGYEHVLKILNWHKLKKLRIVVSNRFYEPDAARMTDETLKPIKDILDKYSIEVMPNVFRTAVSYVSGRDVLSGTQTIRSQEELRLFEILVGKDPLKRTRNISQHIGDYDALKEHFCSGRDYFITRDKKNIFSSDKRRNFFDQLELQIMSPEEFISAFGQTQNK